MGVSVLLVQFSSDRNGSAISGLSLANGMRKRGWETFVAFANPGPMEEEYRTHGHQVSVLQHKSWLRRSHPGRFFKDLILEWRKAAAFQGLMNQIAPDVVYINTAVSLAAAVAAKRNKVKVVWHLRELFSDVGGEMAAPPMAKPFIRILLSWLSDLILVNSRAVAINMLGKSLAQRAILVPNAVTEDCFDTHVSKRAARQSLGLPLSVTIVGVPGTLRPMKGHSFFIRAAAELFVKHPQLVFAITGEGELEFVEKLKEEAERLGIVQRLIFTGVLNGLNPFYRACDIVCIPSKAEPFGRVVIEAFAAGSPVIATSVGGIPEIVDDHVNGLLVPYGNTTVLACAVEQLLDDEGLRNRLATNARKKAKREFSEVLYQTNINRQVESLLANREKVPQR